MKVEIINNELVITLPLTTPVPSASGKTLLVATTHGNLKTDLQIEGKPLTVAVNAYIPNK
jgi:hypothetical protein